MSDSCVCSHALEHHIDEMHRPIKCRVVECTCAAYATFADADAQRRDPLAQDCDAVQRAFRSLYV